MPNIKRLTLPYPSPQNRRVSLLECPFLTHGRAWLNRVVPKNFKDVAAPKEWGYPHMVYIMDSYHTVLYLTIKLCQIAVLLCNKTITKGAHHC